MAAMPAHLPAALTSLEAPGAPGTPPTLPPTPAAAHALCTPSSSHGSGWEGLPHNHSSGQPSPGGTCQQQQSGRQAEDTRAGSWGTAPSGGRGRGRGVGLWDSSPGGGHGSGRGPGGIAAAGVAVGGTWGQQAGSGRNCPSGSNWSERSAAMVPLASPTPDSWGMEEDGGAYAAHADSRASAHLLQPAMACATTSKPAATSHAAASGGGAGVHAVAAWAAATPSRTQEHDKAASPAAMPPTGQGMSWPLAPSHAQALSGSGRAAGGPGGGGRAAGGPACFGVENQCPGDHHLPSAPGPVPARAATGPSGPALHGQPFPSSPRLASTGASAAPGAASGVGMWAASKEGGGRGKASQLTSSCSVNPSATPAAAAQDEDTSAAAAVARGHAARPPAAGAGGAWEGVGGDAWEESRGAMVVPPAGSDSGWGSGNGPDTGVEWPMCRLAGMHAPGSSGAPKELPLMESTVAAASAGQPVSSYRLTSAWLSQHVPSMGGAAHSRPVPSLGAAESDAVSVVSSEGAQAPHPVVPAVVAGVSSGPAGGGSPAWRESGGEAGRAGGEGGRGGGVGRRGGGARAPPLRGGAAGGGGGAGAPPLRGGAAGGRGGAGAPPLRGGAAGGAVDRSAR